MRCPAYVFLAVFVLFSLVSLIQAWGSAPIPNSFRPSKSWADNFPSTPTVEVSEGESVEQGISLCDEQVGPTGYCHIHLTGNPSDKTIFLTRSRTKLSSDGTEITSSGSVTFVSISTSGLSDIVIENLNLRGHRAEEVFGIFVSGSGISNVIIRNNNIYNFDGISNAHGIAVYGSGSTPIRDVSIDLNEVYNMKTGSSESIVVNGNVRGWEIVNNYVHDVNNIAIDCIGGEGTLPPSPGTNLPNTQDVAREGFIEYNTVERMSTRTNGQYGNVDTWAAGIYVDGAKKVHINGNTLKDTPWGIEVGAENCIITSDILVTFNTVSSSFYGDFLTGGYSPVGYLADSSIQCNPLQTQDSSEGHGYVQRITVRDNTFSTTSGQEDNILAQYRTTYAIIAEPGVTPVNADGDGSATGDDNAIRTS